MKSEGKFGMDRTEKEVADLKAADQIRMRSRSTEQEVGSRFNAPRFEGPKLISRSEFAKEADRWRNQINKAQEDVLREMKTAGKKGQSIEALEARAKGLEIIREQLWNVELTNSREFAENPEGFVPIDSQLYDVLQHPSKAVEFAGFEHQLTDRKSGLAEGERRMQEENLAIIERAEAEREILALQKERKAIDAVEDKMIESGNFDAIALTSLDLKRQELKEATDRFFERLHDLAQKLGGAIEA